MDLRRVRSDVDRGVDLAVLYAQKWRWYRRAQTPWHLAALHFELARRQCFARGRLYGEPLQLLREGRLQLGEQTLFEDGVWLTSYAGRIEIGASCILNRNVMVAASDLVQIGDHTLIGNGCLITDSAHRNDDTEVPMPWQGYASKGPTRIGDNTWIGVNSVITSGVTVGRRCAIGANSVVTRDIPDFSVAVGSPAKVIRSLRG
ncbi:Hexapeptide repeat of succinyl-transferase [Frankineae bacterium MT45]|nr:Hexapeptide repeat of succinyl-transferase [Frankineae bacterium MT45]